MQIAQPLTSLLMLLALFTPVQAALLKTDDFRLSIRPRTPEQIAAFYEARGFPRTAIDELKQQCYIGVSFHNSSDSIIWLELDNWRFSTRDGALQRRDRAYWKKRWAALGLDLRFQSTFRWTLMPERLDFRPDEREGGNLILPYTPQPIRLEAKLRIVAGDEVKIIPIQLDDIRCQR